MAESLLTISGTYWLLVQLPLTAVRRRTLSTVRGRFRRKRIVLKLFMVVRSPQAHLQAPTLPPCLLPAFRMEREMCARWISSTKLGASFGEQRIVTAK